MSFDVLNPSGKDSTQDFSSGPGMPGQDRHPPVNYHAYAACMKGRFICRISEIRDNPVLLLLRSDLSHSLHAAKILHKRGHPFLISWKEAGRHQVAAAISHPLVLKRFQSIGLLAKGFLASTSWLPAIYCAAGFNCGRFVPTPYPLDFPEWDFRVPIEKRMGIFLGTREFLIPSRNHAAAVMCACNLAQRLGIHVTCINTDGRRGRALLKAIDANRGILQIIEGKLSYERYLNLLAQHRLVFQLDRSGVPGQVAGDAALCGIPAIGGDGSIDNVLNTASVDCDVKSTIEYAHDLLTNIARYVEVTEIQRQRAQQMLSFQSGAQQLSMMLKNSICSESHIN